eukprot:scaffold20696_cov112-Isochrysis_galbana.AAC.1
MEGGRIQVWNTSSRTPVYLRWVTPNRGVQIPDLSARPSLELAWLLTLLLVSRFCFTGANGGSLPRSLGRQSGPRYTLHMDDHRASPVK